MKKQAKIKKLRMLIQGSLFLDEAVKRELLDNLDRVGDEDLDLLFGEFGKAKKKQKKLVDAIVTYDETFVERMKQFNKKQISDFYGKTEREQREEESAEKILTNINEDK
jgi:hypothetical protein